jgi:hypothetical protein
MNIRCRQVGIFLCIDSWDIFAVFFNYIGYRELKDIITVNVELVRMWKEAVVIYFKGLAKYSPGGTEEKHEYLSQDNRSLNQGWNSGVSKNEAGILTTGLRYSLVFCTLGVRNK